MRRRHLRARASRRAGSHDRHRARGDRADRAAAGSRADGPRPRGHDPGPRPLRGPGGNASCRRRQPGPPGPGSGTDRGSGRGLGPGPGGPGPPPAPGQRYRPGVGDGGGQDPALHRGQWCRGQHVRGSQRGPGPGDLRRDGPGLWCAHPDWWRARPPGRWNTTPGSPPAPRGCAGPIWRCSSPTSWNKTSTCARRRSQPRPPRCHDRAQRGGEMVVQQ